VTPIEHPDRIPLQMALTQLEYLADNLDERRREAELRQKVKQLDASTAHISKVNMFLNSCTWHKITDMSG